MLSQLAKQSLWNISANSSIADENYQNQRKTLRLIKKIVLPGWISFKGSEDAFRFVTNFRPRSKLVYFIRCRLGWLQTSLGKPLHCDTRRTKLVNKGFTRIYVCVVTYYFICLQIKQFFSLVPRYYGFSLLQTLNLLPTVSAITGVDYIQFYYD